MAFISDTQPLCRYCGKPIKKHTRTLYFGAGETSQKISSDLVAYRPEKPTSKAEAQKLVNEQIVSVGWAVQWCDGEDGSRVSERDYIDKATTWDGVSYVDEFFCTAEHARWFGYAAVRTGIAMPDYHNAIKQQKEGRT